MGRTTKVKGARWLRKPIGKHSTLLEKISDDFLIMNGPAPVETPAPVGKKLDVGKSPVTRGVLWYFPRALLAVADVSAYGAKKYELRLEEQNWKSVPDGFGRYADAEGRHLLKQAIHPFDKESNLRHIQMEAWNALAKLELTLIELEKDGTVNFD